MGADQVYVIFLTRDGVENPDPESLESMYQLGICDTNEGGVISGPRYFPCSYSQNILNWLKDDVQPLVPQKDVVLNAGLIQYIDYLEQYLGCGMNMHALKNEYKEWFDNHVQLSGDIVKDNTCLYELYNLLSKQACDDDSVKSDAVNTLKNVIEAKNDELMKSFLAVTKDFFTGGDEPLIKDYHLNHHFTYYYITIRDKAWPKGIDFGWYPLGLKRLSEKNELILNFKFKGKRLEQGKEQLLSDLGFAFQDKTGTYRKTILVTKGENGNGTFFSQNEKEQEDFLREVYRNNAEPVIMRIVKDLECL